MEKCKENIEKYSANPLSVRRPNYFSNYEMLEKSTISPAYFEWVNYYDHDQDGQYQNDRSFHMMVMFFKVILFFKR